MRVVPGLTCLGLMLGALASPVHAAEDEWIFTTEAGWSLYDGAQTQHGLGGQVQVGYGVSDAAWLTFSLGGAQHFSKEDAPSRTDVEAFGGLQLAFDVFRAIPFLEAMVGAVWGPSIVEDKRIVGPTLRLGLGADYFVTRDVSIGIVGRYRVLPEEMGDGILTMQGRFSYRIDF